MLGCRRPPRKFPSCLLNSELLKEVNVIDDQLITPEYDHHSTSLAASGSGVAVAVVPVGAAGPAGRHDDDLVSLIVVFYRNLKHKLVSSSWDTFFSYSKSK